MYKRILVPIDGSPASQSGLEAAMRLAKQNKARLRLLHVVGLFIATPVLSRGRYVGNVSNALREGGTGILESAERLVRRHRVMVDTVLLESARGRAAGAIVEHAKKWRADLIVIGSHGRRGLRRLALGSEAERIIRASPSPVVVVRPAKTPRAKDRI
jgi:nucleotide-binding universal stress UspA family protein